MVVQLLRDEITMDKLLQALDGVHTIYTYNGSRFDLPFIKDSLGIDLLSIFTHHDLMYDCWKLNLKGGLKVVESRLGISRRLDGITGLDAVMLWQKYEREGDQTALQLLLQYNKEDVTNLRVLREKLWEAHSFK